MADDVIFPFIAEKECPFCGENVVQFVRAVEPCEVGQFQLLCHNCGARGPTYDAAEDAKDGWNYGIGVTGGNYRTLKK